MPLLKRPIPFHPTVLCWQIRHPKGVVRFLWNMKLKCVLRWRASGDTTPQSGNIKFALVVYLVPSLNLVQVHIDAIWTPDSVPAQDAIGDELLDQPVDTR